MNALYIVSIALSAVFASKQCCMPDRYSSVEDYSKYVNGSNIEFLTSKISNDYNKKMTVVEYVENFTHYRLLKDYEYKIAYLSINGTCEQYDMPPRQNMKYRCWSCGWRPAPGKNHHHLATGYAKVPLVYFVASQLYRSRKTMKVTRAEVELSLIPIKGNRALLYELRRSVRDKDDTFLEHYNYHDYLIGSQVADDTFTPPMFCKIRKNFTILRI